MQQKYRQGLWLIISLLSFGVYAAFAAQDEKASDAAPLPTTVEATVADILANMSKEDQEKLGRMKREELIKLHFGLGMYIRNHYGLWGKNRPLLDAGCQLTPKPCHPDDVSMAIVERVWYAVKKDKP